MNTTLPYARPIVLLSKCLEFDHCRYNGQMIPDELVRQLTQHVTFKTVCPEVEIGLGIPREPIALYEGEREREGGGGAQLIQMATGKNLTQPMHDFSQGFLKHLGPVDGAILKSRSPSCGIKQVKVAMSLENRRTSYKQSGLFAENVLQALDGLAIEEEGRLKNFTIREHFLTHLFTQALFREIQAKQKVKDLVQFHATHKFLLMAYNETAMREMGKLLGRWQKGQDVQALYKAYGQLLQRVFQKAARYTSNINVLEHCFGFFKKQLSPSEKQHFKRLLEQYRNAMIPLSAVNTLLSSWVIRFEESYLAQQRFFAPYPPALVEITDSGKGRDR